MAKFSIEEWQKKMAYLDEQIKKQKEEETKQRSHWLWSEKSIKRYNDVLEKYGRWKRGK